MCVCVWIGRGIDHTGLHYCECVSACLYVYGWGCVCVFVCVCVWGGCLLFSWGYWQGAVSEA